MDLSKEIKLTPEQLAEKTLVNYWDMQFKNAMVAKAPYTKRWATYWDAYYGDYFKNKSLPDYKSNLVSNYIFSIVETIRPIMFDNDPKFQVLPRQPDGMQFANDLQEVLSYEWDREDMGIGFIREAITMLVTGTAVLFMPWNAKEKNVKPVFVNPDNIFVDPLATSVQDCGYIMYASYKHKNQLKMAFPSKADKFIGSSVNYSELVNGNDKDAKVHDQILVIEAYVRDFESTIENVESGTKMLKYPKGRVITFCPEIGVLLEDKPNPYDDGSFPFRLIKDYDVPGKFWGEGEIAQLLSPQSHMNDLNNSILDNAKLTANSPWIVDKNAGIGEGKITSRPGLIIRKTPGTEVRREQPSNMPNYVVNAVETFKNDMEQVSGIFSSVKGNSETGVYTAQGILALQEAGQARVRLKVKLLESALSEIAQMWISRIRQFWKQGRYIRVTRFAGEYDIKMFSMKAFEYDYDVKISAGSTMPVNRGAMLDLMIRLAQTPMPDGQNLVDREAVVQYLPEEAKSTILRRMNGENTIITQKVQQIEQALQQNEQNDQQTMSTLEQIASALEQLKGEILQLSDKHDKLEKDKAEQDKLTKATSDGYNQGYTDAEKLQGTPLGEETPFDKGSLNDQEGLPDDILSGLEGLSDEELQAFLQTNPDASQLIK